MRTVEILTGHLLVFVILGILEMDSIVQVLFSHFIWEMQIHDTVA